MDQDAFTDAVRRNASVSAALDRLPRLGLRQCHLTAGCLFQTVWNLRHGYPPDHGIRDYDVFYWDQDTSWTAEDDAIRCASSLFAGLGIPVEVRNQARVHLWFQSRFGTPCPPLESARAGIDRFLVACTAIGIAAETGEVYAPYGLGDLAAGVLRINPRYPHPARFRAKAEDYRRRWPRLLILEPHRAGDLRGREPDETSGGD